MEDRIEIGMCRTYLENNTEYVYRYYLLNRNLDMQFMDREINMDCYGIEILREKYINGNLIDILRDSVDCVSTVRDKVVELIGYLKDNEVSPIHLIDIIGEKVDKWVGDFDNSAKKLLNRSYIA